MVSLTSLAGWEEAVLASVNGATGTADERDRQIERSGMYGEYPAIVRAYLELQSDPAQALEAIKRAIFLVWRSAMVSPEQSGIATLPDGTVRGVLDALDAAILNDLADDELAWMLAWYRGAGAFVFELFGGTPRVLRYGAELPEDAWRRQRIDAGLMARRGQMGRYWSALAAGAP